MSEDEPCCKEKRYTIQPGDTLFKIARKYNLTVADLLEANPQIKSPDELFVGQVICIPVEPVVSRDCAIVLTLSREAGVALPAIAGGVVLIQKTDEGNYALTFAATGLPSPQSIGDFDTYIGSINLDGQQYSAILRESSPFEQESTWAGTRVISDNPFDYPESAVTIVPFNLETSIRTNPILGGEIAECRE